MKLVCTAVTLVAIGIFLISQVFYKKQTLQAASARLQERTRAAVEKNPQLKADWDKAQEDGVLTYPEAKAILEKGGEKVDPEE